MIITVDATGYETVCQAQAILPKHYVLLPQFQRHVRTDGQTNLRALSAKTACWGQKLRSESTLISGSHGLASIPVYRFVL